MTLCLGKYDEKSRFTESSIATILKLGKAGMLTNFDQQS